MDRHQSEAYWGVGEQKEPEVRTVALGRKYYKPLLLRTPSLAVLLVLSLLLIGLTEFACQKLPAANSHGMVANLAGRSLYRERIAKKVKEDGVFLEHRQEIVDRTETQPPGTSAPAPSNYLATGTRTTTQGPGTSAPAPSNYLTTGPHTVTPSAPGPTNYLNTGARTTTQLIKISTPEPTPSTAAPTNYLTPGPVTRTLTSTTSKITAPTAPDPNHWLSTNGKADKVIVYDFTQRDYILGAFVPTVIAVLFTIPWVLLDSTAKELEPFYQLASSVGVTAENSFCLDYPGLNIFVTPILALFRGHGIIVQTSLLQLVSLGLAPLASETVFIGLNGTDCSATIPCSGIVSIYPVAARVIEGLLAGMAVLVIGLMISMRRRTSGVFANPNSLAGIASLFHNPQLVNFFRSLDLREKEKILKKQLEAYDYRYRLGYYQHFDGTTPYGFMIAQESTYGEIQYAGQVAKSHRADNNQPVKNGGSNKWQIFLSLMFAACLLGILALIVYYFLTGGNTGFERFMDSQSFGVRFLFTVVGIMIKKFWEKTRTYLRKTEPYHNLRLGSTLPNKSILLNPTCNPLSSALSSLSRGDLALPFIDLATLLSEPLTVTLSNIPFSNGTTYLGFIICTYISLSILAFMLLALSITLFKLLKMRGDTVPETLAEKMAVLAGSHMLERFKVLGIYGDKGRDKWIKGMGERFAIGEVVSEDGVARKAVDFEGFVKARGGA